MLLRMLICLGGHVAAELVLLLLLLLLVDVDVYVCV